jgi:hypothetical protein
MLNAHNASAVRFSLLLFFSVKRIFLGMLRVMMAFAAFSLEERLNGRCNR